MFRLTDQPVIFPALTILGNAAGPVVDTGCELPSGGRVYIDRTEASMIAGLFGFETPEQAERRTNRIEQLEAQLDEALATIARVREQVIAETVHV